MKGRDVVLVGGILAVALTGALFASESPDGLEKVATDLGFADHETSLHAAPMADYEVAGASGGLSKVGAALIGTALVGGLCWGAGALLKRG